MSVSMPMELLISTPLELRVIDLSQPLDELGREFREALASVGFVYVQAQGVDDILSEAFATLRNFFDLSVDEKTHSCSTNRALRGYSPLCCENFASLAGTKRPNDPVEKFRVGPLASLPKSSTPRSKAHAQFYFSNTWPQHPAQLQPCVESLYSAMSMVADRIAEGLASALGLHTSYFKERMQHPTSILSANHFPETPAGDASASTHIAAHTDVSLFTIVAEQVQAGCHRSSSGLEVLVGDDTWLETPAKPGALIVNIGDCLSDWSQGAFASTVHRVVHKPGQEEGQSRLSLAFFVTPDPESSVDPRRLAEDRQIAATSSGDLGSAAEASKGDEAPWAAVESELTYFEWRKRRIKRAMNILRGESR